MDFNVFNSALEQWDSVAKPLRSLGILEQTVSKIAGITRSTKVAIDKRAVVIMCADNGVVEEGVSQSDSSVTAIVAKAIANGSSNINVMAKTFNADVFPLDVGMKTDVPEVPKRKLVNGTANITKGPAMTIEQAEYAIVAGMDMVKDLKERGYQIIVSGEMGIGNTTTAAALASVLLYMTPEEVTGRGAGLSSEGMERKITAIRQAIEVNKPDIDKPVELLAKLGGFDIAGMVGLFLGGAVYHIPVVIDGMISAVAAHIAGRTEGKAAQYMLPSHVSREPAGALLLERIWLDAPINAWLRLGEGTGGVLLLPLLDGALSVYNSAHRFDDLPMERYTSYL